jgi:argininosuccinate synthase
MESMPESMIKRGAKSNEKVQGKVKVKLKKGKETEAIMNRERQESTPSTPE